MPPQRPVEVPDPQVGELVYIPGSDSYALVVSVDPIRVVDLGTPRDCGLELERP